MEETMKGKLFAAAFILIAFIAAQIFAVISQILPSQLIEILVPVVVWLASGIVNWLKAKLVGEGFGGTVLVSLIVPLLSLAATFVASLIKPEMNFWLTFFLGMLGVTINELIKQWNQTLKGKQTKADKNLIG